MKPTSEQEKQLLVNSDCARYAYNWTVAQLKEWHPGDPRRSKFDLAKELRALYKTDELVWMQQGCSQAIKQAVYDADIALQNFFHGRGYPKFKSRHRCMPKFYVRPDRLKVDTMRVWIIKVGWVVTSEQLPRGITFSNPRASFDGKYWYLAVGVENDEAVIPATGEVIGVDLGIKVFATVSDGRTYPNISKSRRVRQLTMRLKRAQRKQARRYTKNKGKESSQNHRKAKAQVRLIYRKIAGIRKNHCHQVTADLVRTKPSVIVIEDLNVSGMLKNHRMSRAIAEESFAEFRRQLAYKSERNGIVLQMADRFYPSSKRCSVCGRTKERLSLGERIYRCECGAVLDRDQNAAINLARLATAH